MRRMVRWNPYQNLALYYNGGRMWRPALDVVDSEDAFIVRAVLPGFKPEDIEVKVEDDVLTLKAERAEEHEETGENYLLRERANGSYCRAVRLPAAVDAEKASAEVENGILTLTLPKREEFKPKQIPVKVS